jgi:hypothetical protein
MSQRGTLTWRLAIVLLKIATWLLPQSRAEWARAMLSEMHNLNDNRQAVLWAAGCCITGIKERMYAMISDKLKISPWILCPELMLCFVPLSIGWLDAVFSGSGVTRLNFDVIQRYFLSAPGGPIALAMMIALAFFGVLGPVGLIAAFRLVVLGHPMRTRWLRTAMVVGPLFYGVLTLMFRFAVGGSVAFNFNAVDAFDYWSGVLLLSFLPAVGAVHIILFGPERSAERVTV